MQPDKPEPVWIYEEELIEPIEPIDPDIRSAANPDPEPKRDYLPMGFRHANRYTRHEGFKQYAKRIEKEFSRLSPEALAAGCLQLEEIQAAPPELHPKIDRKRLDYAIARMKSILTTTPPPCTPQPH